MRKALPVLLLAISMPVAADEHLKCSWPCEPVAQSEPEKEVSKERKALRAIATIGLVVAASYWFYVELKAQDDIIMPKLGIHFD